MANTEDIIINVEVTGAKDSEKAIKDTTRAIEDNKKATEEAEKEQVSYSNSLIDSAKDAKVFGVSLNSLSASFTGAVRSLRTMNGALKSFKVALASTGIGLLVIALGSLVTWLQRSRQGLDFFNDAMAVVSQTVKIVLDRLGRLGGAIVKLFKGDFKGAFNEAKAALTGFNEELRETLKTRLEIEEAIRDADEFDRQAISRRADLQREIADLILETRDLENTTAQERLALLEEARKKQEELNSVNVEAARLRLEIADQELSLLKEEDAAFEDSFKARQEAYAAFVQAQKSGSDALRQIQNRTNTENTKLAAEQKKAAEARAEREAEQRQLDLEALNEFNAERVSLEEGYQESRLELENNTTDAILRLQEKIKTDQANNAKARLKIEEETNKAIAEGASNLFGGIAALYGQNSVLGKAAAVAQATIDTFRAVNTILADATLPTVAKPAFIAASIAQGLASVKRIASTPLPKVQIESSPFAKGGEINGPGHSRGGVWLNAEGGEYIVNKQAMRDPVKRSIVEAINENKQSSGLTFQNGGFVPSSLQLLNIESAIREARPVLILEDLDLAQGAVQVREDLTNL